MTGERTTPTVVVARRPAPGREVEFEHWLRRLVAAAETAPGYRASDLQRPNAVHPDEWVVVFQFSDAGTLRGWLNSEVRAGLMAEGSSLIAGPAREQVLALNRADHAVTAVSSFRIKPGNERAYSAWHERLTERMRTFPGFVRTEEFRPVPGVQDDHVVVFAFDSRQHLDDWLGSEERLGILREIAPLLEGDRTVNVVGGFAGWFGLPGMAEVKRWKQAAMVLLAIFPTTLVLTQLRMWLAPDLPWVLGVLIGNVLGVIALSWVLMPTLTRLFDGWLRR